MMQKIQDLLLLLRSSRKAQSIVLVTVLAVLFVQLQQTHKGTKWVKPAVRVAPEQLVREESTDVVMQDFRNEVDTIKANSQKLIREHQQSTEELTQFEGQVVGIFQKMLKRMETIDDRLDSALDKVAEKKGLRSSSTVAYDGTYEGGAYKGPRKASPPPETKTKVIKEPRKEVKASAPSGMKAF